MGIYDGQVVIIAGGGAGIGAAAAQLLATRGATVVVTDVVKANAEQVSAEINSAGGKSGARLRAHHPVRRDGLLEPAMSRR